MQKDKYLLNFAYVFKDILAIYLFTLPLYTYIYII